MQNLSGETDFGNFLARLVLDEAGATRRMSGLGHARPVPDLGREERMEDGRDEDDSRVEIKWFGLDPVDQGLQQAVR